ncbi:SLC13 family permease [Isoalcanivorax indicus]|uniref:SLC13 family permease n=1 Tax=Isoalcanivorax indicus TaxID=2202653 RepID=UPI000DB9A29C|nr:DASS family sodium-coupled anion symporter [Isoalcanivorax indicus]
MSAHPLRLLLAAVLAAAAWHLPEAPDHQAGLALFVLIATLWLTEALPLTVTALLVPVMAAALGLSPLPEALQGFAHPIIFLFLGGFALAAALSHHGIDRWLAAQLLRLARGKPLPAALLLSGITALLSMWISNTATAAMMLPVALGLLAPLGSDFPRFRLFLLLGLAWGANIGGIATLIGSPPNAIAAAALGWQFMDWLRVGLPAFALLFPLALAVLYGATRPEPGVPRLDIGPAPPFPRSRAAMMALGVFAVTVLLWVLGKPLAAWTGIRETDAWVALLAIVLLGITGALDWRTIEQRSNWGVLLLFGGGITLGNLMDSSGTSHMMAGALQGILPGGDLWWQRWLLHVLIALFVVMLTELVSNTASTALLVPLLGAVAVALGVSDVSVVVLIAVCASCAFMLPVATPPNALVYGTGEVPQQAMIRAGLRLNLLCALLLGTLASTLVPLLIASS